MINFALSSTWLTLATQALGQRPTGASATTAPVRTMPQYKYAAGVRNPQQHLASQPQVAMQQVKKKGCELDKQGPKGICRS